MAYARALSAFTIATVALIHRKFHSLLENCNLYLLCHALNISLPYTKALHMSSFIRVSEKSGADVERWNASSETEDDEKPNRTEPNHPSALN